MMIIRTYSPQMSNPWDYTMKPRKNESQDRFMTRVYDKIADRQNETIKAVKFELIEASSNIKLDTFYGLLDK